MSFNSDLAKKLQAALVQGSTVRVELCFTPYFGSWAFVKLEYYSFSAILVFLTTAEMGR
jgi:hypothetical protein